MRNERLGPFGWSGILGSKVINRSGKKKILYIYMCVCVCVCVKEPGI